MDLTPTISDLLVLATIGIGTGAIGAILGTGGGVFLIPALVIGYKMPIHFAVGTSILSVIATSTAVASTNVERGTANMRLGMTLEIATSMGAIAGGLTAAWLPNRVLEIVFALVLLPTAAVMWRRRAGDGESGDPSANVDPAGPATAQTKAAGEGRLGSRYLDHGREVVYRVKRLWAGLCVSFTAGIMSGLLGIGGGIFKVPALNLLCEVPIKAAAATSNFMIGVTAAASAFLYFGRGEVHPTITTAVVLGILAGSVIGSYLNQFIGGLTVKRLFAVLLLGVAAQMLSRVLWAGS